MRRAARLAAVAVALASAAPAQTPRSAIPWLSDTVRPLPATSAGPRPAPAPQAVEPFDPGRIASSALDDPLRDGLGLVPGRDLGLPPGFWGDSSALRIARGIAQHPQGGVPATRALFHRLMIAETAPPRGATPANRVLLARIDALMARGRLDAAAALVDAAQVTEPQLFRRAFDIALLTGTADARCEQLARSPALSPTLPTRVFCLARQGDWDGAALTLQLAAEMGSIPPERVAALEWFLDPALFEAAAPPPPPEPMTTLDFVLREAVGLPRPPGPLPLAFAHLDAGGDAPLRTRIEARERLARAGATPAARLLAAYRAGTPAASGGVWDRAAAVQALDRALAIGAPPRIAPALATAEAAFDAADLRPALAAGFARQLVALPAADYPAAARARIGELLLLAGEHGGAAAGLPGGPDATSRFLAALAAGRPLPDAGSLPPLWQAVARGFAAGAPPTESGRRLAALLASGAWGEAVLGTLALLAPGAEIDPADLTAALVLLRRAGLDEAARQIAAETLLLLPRA